MTAPNVLAPITVLPPGTTTFQLTGLSPSTEYTAVLAHQEPPPSTGYTQPASVTFESSSSVGTCAAPDDPVPFVFPAPPAHGGMPICGVACFNNDPVPGTSILVQMATETSPGSGTYGAWQTIDQIPTNPLSWCIKTLTIQQDGNHREFQMQAVRAGCNSSSFTPIVTLLPNVALAPADFPIAMPAITFGAANVIQPSGMTLALLASYTPPTDHELLRMDYLVQSWTGSAWGTAQLVAGSNQGSDVIVAQATAGGQYLVTPVTVSTGESGVQVAPGVTIAATRNSGTPTVVPAPALSNAPIPTLASAGSTAIYYTIPFDVGTAYYVVYSTNPSSNPGSIDSVESPANAITPLSQLYPPKGGGSTLLALPVTSGNPWRATTFVPYNMAGVRGVATTIITQRSTAVTTPTAPTLSLATFGGTGGTNGGSGPSGGNWNFPGWVGIKVTFVTAPSAGDQITLYRSGAQCSPLYTITSGDVTAGFATVIDQTFVSSGTQAYTATQTGTVSGGGTSAASTAFNVTLGSAFKLSGLASLTLTGGNSYRAPMFVTGTMPADGEFPPEAALTIQYAYTASPSGYGGPWTTLTAAGVSGTSYTIAPQPLYYTVVQVFATCPNGYTNGNTSTTNKQNAGLP